MIRVYCDNCRWRGSVELVESEYPPCPLCKNVYGLARIDTIPVDDTAASLVARVEKLERRVFDLENSVGVSGISFFDQQ